MRARPDTEDLSEDPAGLQGGINQYAFAGDDPVNASDPSGLYSCAGVTINATICDDPFEFPGSSSYPASVYGGDVSFAGGWDDAILPKICTNALHVAGSSAQAVVRADDNWNILTTAANNNGIDPSFLASIGVRESGFQDVSEHDGAGVGVGVFQLTVSAKSTVTAAQASDLTWAANYAANMLSSNMTALSNLFPKFTSAQLLQATAASYNFGVSNIHGNPGKIDVGTTGNNYGRNVLQLMMCF